MVLKVIFRAKSRNLDLGNTPSKLEDDNGTGYVPATRGYTVIELVVVIAILGILFAAAIPKYIDLMDDADKAHDNGMVSGLRVTTLMLYTTNCLGSVLQSHTGVTNYWPAEGDITNRLTEPVVWRYYATHIYNPTTGVWTVSE